MDSEDEETNDEESSVEIGQFSSCSHRFSKVLQSLLQHPKCFDTATSAAVLSIGVLAATRAPRFPNFCSLLMAPLLLRCTAALSSWRSTPPSASPPLTGVTAMTKKSGGIGTREMRTGAGQWAPSPGVWSGGAALLVWALASAQGLCQDQGFVLSSRVCGGTEGLCCY